MTLIPLDRERTMREQRETIAHLRALLGHLLIAPWSGAREFAVTAACVEMEHPPRFEGASECVCRSITYPPREAGS